MNPNRLRVGWVAVAYNTDEHAVRFGRSLAAAEKPSVQVDLTLIDNSEEPNPALKEAMREIAPRCTVRQSGTNVGYFGAMNQWKRTLGIDLLTYDFIAVSNVDLELSPQFFERLSRLRIADGTGVIAPSVRSRFENRDLNPKLRKRPSPLRMLLRYGLHQLPLEVIQIAPVAGMLRRKLTKGFAVHGEQRGPIYAPHGSVMLFTKELSRRGGLPEYPVFLFGEEIFVAEEVARMGLAVQYHPTLVVYDWEHASTGIIRNRTIARYVRESISYLYRNYFSG